MLSWIFLTTKNLTQLWHKSNEIRTNEFKNNIIPQTELHFLFPYFGMSHIKVITNSLTPLSWLWSHIWKSKKTNSIKVSELNWFRTYQILIYSWINNKELFSWLKKAICVGPDWGQFSWMTWHVESEMEVVDKISFRSTILFDFW